MRYVYQIGPVSQSVSSWKSLHNKCESRAFISHLVNANVLNVWHVAKNRENNQTRQDARERVDRREDPNISVGVVVEFVVAAQSNQGWDANAISIEHLGACVWPHWKVEEPWPIGLQVVADAVHWAG